MGNKRWKLEMIPKKREGKILEMEKFGKGKNEYEMEMSNRRNSGIEKAKKTGMENIGDRG